ncbi:MAG: carbohydrate porin [Thermoanaerobaculia bacterium]
MRKSVLFAAGLCLLALVLGLAAAANAQISGLYYKEVEKDGRVYVFNIPETFKAWSASGDMGKAVTLIGRAEGDKTLVGDNETAVDLYLFKHNLPAYDRPTPQPVVPAKYPATKIQGRFYGDFTSKQNKTDAGAKSSDSGVGIDVKRFYFTVTHEFDSIWSAQFQSDIGDQGAKRYDVFVKKAYLQGKLSDAFAVRLGSADTPWIPFAESNYSMRYFEQTITDTLGFGTSADWGVHVLGKLAGDMVDYQVSALNGKGYSNPTRTESVDLEGRVSVKPFAGFTLGIGGYSGKLGNETRTAPAKHTAERLNAFAGYTSGRLNVGVEYFQAKNWKNVTTVATDKADGYSLWAQFALNKTMRLFARYDQADPSKDLAPAKQITYYNLGFEKQFNKSVTANIAYKYAETEGGAVATGNGGVGAGAINGKYQEIGIWAVYNF